MRFRIVTAVMVLVGLALYTVGLALEERDRAQTSTPAVEPHATSGVLLPAQGGEAQVQFLVYREGESPMPVELEEPEYEFYPPGCYGFSVPLDTIWLEEEKPILQEVQI